MTSAASIRIAIIRFPGSNADWDALHSLRDILGADAYYVFHKESSLNGDATQPPDAVIIPGGFSYGDYLRPGAIAAKSPIMKEVVAFAERGQPVLGICNGFQILTEVGLLPGTLSRNENLRFECRDVLLRVEGTGVFSPNQDTLRLPIAHADGRYHADDATLERLEENGQIAFRYATKDGLPGANPNGSVHDIAGVYNETGNVLGMMPHPERACDPLLGNNAGRALFESMFNHIQTKKHGTKP